jgi:acyl-CoA thioester hydrolase
MRIVHHANYVRWFELARLDWMDTHHVPYRRYYEEGLHFATTRLEVDYRSPARFDDRVTIVAWLGGLGGASLTMNYLVECERRTLVTGHTEHACVGDDGRVRRIPAERRADLRRLLAGE